VWHAKIRILGAFSDLYRLLKPHTFCSSFNGWQAVDKFYRAWIDAGFRAVGHIVFVKDYASSERCFRGHHEQAYLLIKGRPARPAKPLEDVLPWTYTGNRMHPTEKAVPTLAPLIRTFSRPGDVVLDPFCGSGSTLVAAGLLGRVISELSLRRGTADWPDAG
jgi:site-specific DNA-methyltransferase (adenine-specific)